MPLDERMRELAREIEACLDCFKWFPYSEDFKDYDDEDKIRIRGLFNRGPWLFPPHNCVKGFFGTYKVFFVCEQPSTATFPNANVERFYQLLKKEGFANAHITDIVKCRSKINERNYKKWKEWADTCFKHFEKELEILDPDLIVAVEDNVFQYLREKLKPRYKDRLYKKALPHYSGPNKNELARQLQVVKEFLSNRLGQPRSTSSRDPCI